MKRWRAGRWREIKATLKHRYHLAGIPEYWLIDARGDELAFDVFYHTSVGYEPAEEKSGWRFSKVFGKKFRLGRVKDPIGGWEYRLDMK